MNLLESSRKGGSGDHEGRPYTIRKDSRIFWRRGTDSNRRIKVLQTSPLATWVPRHLSKTFEIYYNIPSYVSINFKPKVPCPLMRRFKDGQIRNFTLGKIQLILKISLGIYGQAFRNALFMEGLGRGKNYEIYSQQSDNFWSHSLKTYSNS